MSKLLVDESNVNTLYFKKFFEFFLKSSTTSKIFPLITFTNFISLKG